ncbi:hypothetical protein DFJ73DRAFT_819350, partial [Zopfochytrium polystomum]
MRGVRGTSSAEGRRMVMCSVIHPREATCEQYFVGEVGREWGRAVALYGPLNVVMTLLTRGPARLLANPLRTLRSLLLSTLRSSAFLTLYCTSGYYTQCALRRLAGRDARWMYYVYGLVAGAAVMVEAPGRRLELGLYCLPRAVESFWNCGVQWGWWRNVPGGEAIYFSIATGVLMALYQMDTETIPSGYRKVMYRLFGV